MQDKKRYLAFEIILIESWARNLVSSADNPATMETRWLGPYLRGKIPAL
ncbi:MAG: hypothetical protein AABO41_12935 [Acidobacteriota bacterium]